MGMCRTGVFAFIGPGPLCLSSDQNTRFRWTKSLKIASFVHSPPGRIWTKSLIFRHFVRSHFSTNVFFIHLSEPIFQQMYIFIYFVRSHFSRNVFFTHVVRIHFQQMYTFMFFVRTHFQQMYVHAFLSEPIFNKWIFAHFLRTHFQ